MFRTLLAVVACLVGAMPQAVEPFNGKDTTGWKLRGTSERSKWKVGKAALDPQNASKLVVTEGNELVNAEGHSVDIYTEEKFGDVLVELELLVPKGSNSGVYLLGEYEIQVLDSYGKKQVGAGDLGGIYGVSAPKVNASKPAGEWQKLAIDFRAPKFDAEGKKTALAKFVKVELNGQLVQENVEVKGSTGGGLTGKEASTGSLMFQGDHGAVAFRNIKITPLK